ncbi:MAG: hypothetical protein AABW81_02665 [Nanoarchaeota archaeon]
MKHFLFMYPIEEYFNVEIKNRSYGFNKEYYVERVKKKLNKCIDLRYRQKGFQINYALFNDTKISKIIELKESDNVVRNGLNFERHIKEKIYPDENFIINQLNNPSKLIISGFHMWDCVEKVAKRAYKSGFDVLVDEDLTEFFFSRIKERNFILNEYIPYKKRNLDKNSWLMKEILKIREETPWLS